MKRREFMKNAAIVGASAKFAPLTRPTKATSQPHEARASNTNPFSLQDTTISPRTKKLLQDATVIDMTIPGVPGDAQFQTVPFEPYMDDYFANGFNFASCTVAADIPSLESVVRTVARTRKYFLNASDRYLFVEQYEDIERTKKEGKLGINLNLQGSNPLQGDLNMIETYRRLGVGHMLMVYNTKNLGGDGCHERTDCGLSRYGIEVVKEMNRVGMIVDATHTGIRTSMDMFEVSEAPVILSHSIPRALFDHERNVTDEQMKACAQTGGVMGINGVGIFMSKDGGDISPGMLFRQIDYSVELMGEDHVGLGFDCVRMEESVMKAAIGADKISWPKGYDAPNWAFAGAEAVPPLTELMLKKGYSEATVRKILGENWLRICRQVWK